MTKFSKTLIATLVALISATAFATEYPEGYVQPQPTTLTSGSDAAASVGNIQPIQQVTASPTATGTGTATASPTVTANPVNTLTGGNQTLSGGNQTLNSNPTATSSALGGNANLNGTVSGTNQLNSAVNGTNTGNFTNDGRQTTTVGTNASAVGTAVIEKGAVSGGSGTATLSNAGNSQVGVNATNTNSATVQAGAVKNDVSGGNAQQGQTQSTQSGATANNGGGNGNSVVQIDQRQVRQTPMAYAPAIYQTTPCAGTATSGGASTGVFAFSLGHSTIDKECQINSAELTLRQMAALYGEEAAADIAMRIRCKSELLGVNADECNFYREAAKAAVAVRQAQREAANQNAAQLLAAQQEAAQLRQQLAAKQAIVVAPAPAKVVSAPKRKVIVPKPATASCAPQAVPCPTK